MVLGLAESVSMQSMTLTIQALRPRRRQVGVGIGAASAQIFAALLLGGGCGLIVMMIAWLWRGEMRAGAVIGLGVACSLCTACVFGMTVPALLHALKLDPKIAAGPVTLALTDSVALLFYFGLAAALIG